MTAMKLVACVECSRHVRRSDAACPFCGAAFVAAPVSAPRARTSRTLMLAATTATIVACGGATVAEVDSGPAPSDAAPSDAAPIDAGRDQAAVVFYGGPFPQPDASDASPKDAADGGG